MLTPREFDILRLISRDLSSKEIAFDLGVSAATVRAHLSRLRDKLGPLERIEVPPRQELAPAALLRFIARVDHEPVGDARGGLLSFERCGETIEGVEELA